MPEEWNLPSTSDGDWLESRLRRLDQRMERRNRRMLENLRAWAEILDALGWSVALCLPGEEMFLSSRARKWVGEQAEMPLGWADMAHRLASNPPARQLVCSPHLQVWADAEAGVEGPEIENQKAFQTLTKREAEVLGWLREGKAGPEIAIILGCAQRTVESHVARIYRKLGLHNRAQLHFHSFPATR